MIQQKPRNLNRNFCISNVEKLHNTNAKSDYTSTSRKIENKIYRGKTQTQSNKNITIHKIKMLNQIKVFKDLQN